MTETNERDNDDLDDLENSFSDSNVDYYEYSVVLKGLRNIMLMTTPIIPILLDEEEHHLGKRSHGRSVSGRCSISREKELAHVKIWRDYFMDDAKYPLSYFRRRFRMRRTLSLRILQGIESYDSYFTQRCDAKGRKGLSSFQKMTTTIKILAIGSGSAVYNFDEYIQVGESTAIESLKRFCNAIIGLYEEQYMRRPNERDIERLLAQGKARGFPGMLGSLDCMHWTWKNCPTAWHGTHAGVPHKARTLILEVVADKDLRIWHAFFGMSGTHNDINVLDCSHLFDDIINDKAPQCNYVVNGHQYNMGY